MKGFTQPPTMMVDGEWGSGEAGKQRDILLSVLALSVIFTQMFYTKEAARCSQQKPSKTTRSKPNTQTCARTGPWCEATGGRDQGSQVAPHALAFDRVAFCEGGRVWSSSGVQEQQQRASMSTGKEGDDQDRQVEMWKVKKLIKSLQAARG